MTADQIRDAAARAYPGWTVTGVFEGRYTARGGRGEGRGPRRPPDPTASVDLERGGEKKDRLFDPYTGADLGDNFTRGQSAVLWLVRLHDELLLGRLDGGWWNGALSLVFTLVVLTGCVVWWPGGDALGTEPSHQHEERMAPFQLGCPQRARLLVAAVHADVGRLGLVPWIPEPLTAFVERYSDPDGATWRETGRHCPDVAGAAAFRTLARSDVGPLAEAGVGGRRPRPRDHVRHRHDHVVEPGRATTPLTRKIPRMNAGGTYFDPGAGLVM